MKSQKQKYEEAVDRNLSRFLRMQANPNEQPDITPKAEILSKLGLDGLKMRLGIRAKDDSHNAPLIAVLTAAEKSLAKKAEAKKKEKEEAVKEAKKPKADTPQDLEKPPLLDWLFGKRGKKKEPKH